jgi:TolB-like protein/Flp pilus assembly protein TadD
MVAMLALLVTAGSVGAWLSRPAPFDPVLALPDRPSIAVLRFSTDGLEANEDLSVGLAEELIADLSQFKELFVISRNTSFSFDPDASDPRSIGRQLGVEFVARGSARTTERGLRVTAELVDSRTGEAIWTERFDRPVSDVFAIQDEISDAISGRILPELVRSRADASRKRPTDDLSAWDLFLQAKAHQVVFSREGQERAIALARTALDRDPHLAAAHGLIAQAYGNLFFWSDGDVGVRDTAIAAARQALEMDPSDPMAHAALGYVYRFTGDEMRAIGNLERAVALNPNSALIRLQFAHTLDWFRHQERALPEIETAIRLSPRDPLLQNMFFYKAHILFHLQRHEEALEAIDAMGAVVSSGPWEIFYNLMRAAVLAELDREVEARAAIDAARQLDPSLTLTALKSRFDRSNNHPDNRAIWLASLQKAGLSEE